MSKIELKTGQTPWDSMTKDELLIEIWRMYVVIGNLYSIVSMSKHYDEKSGTNNPFWGKEGRGGSALDMTKQTTKWIGDKYESESIYRAFFRVAQDLLFESNGYKLNNFGWVVCDACGVMIGNIDKLGDVCKHGTKDCDGKFRELTWSDIKDRKGR